jgi:hypothetical protein
MDDLRAHPSGRPGLIMHAESAIWPDKRCEQNSSPTYYGIIRQRMSMLIFRISMRWRNARLPASPR